MENLFFCSLSRIRALPLGIACVLRIFSPGGAVKSQVVVIGSGPGGSIAAFYLAQAGLDVALIEEGGEETVPSFSAKELRLKYRAKGQTLTFGSPPVQYVEGCCVGGGSEINSGLYHRLPRSIRKEWENRLQIDSFSQSDLESHYRECESVLSVQTLPSSLSFLIISISSPRSICSFDGPWK